MPKGGSGSSAKAAVAAAEQAAGSAELAVAVLDRRTGELAIGSRGTDAIYAASLSKVVLAVDMLDRRRLGGSPSTRPPPICCTVRWAPAKTPQ